jgi:hypothetical protein
VRNGLLEPRRDSLYRREGFFRQKAVHFIAQAHLDTAVPKPANPDVDFVS